MSQLRYIQQHIVPEIGAQGQQKILQAKVLVIGAGGLGTPVAGYLSSAGVGTIGILDGDQVALSNLSRQFMYTENEAGMPKATVLAAKLMEQNPSIQVAASSEILNELNADEYIGRFDIVCDCTDNAKARILIDRTCDKLQKPLVYAVVSGWEGYVTVLHHARKISLETFFSYQSLLDNELADCSTAGIVNAACGIAGSLQVAEVLKIIIGVSSRLDGGLLAFDASVPVFRLFELNKPEAG